MKPADMLEVFTRLGEKKIPLFDERSHKTFEFEEPLFLKSPPKGENSLACE